MLVHQKTNGCCILQILKMLIYVVVLQVCTNVSEKPLPPSSGHFNCKGGGSMLLHPIHTHRHHITRHYHTADDMTSSPQKPRIFLTHSYVHIVKLCTAD
jgi:hypothetical protein